MIRSEAFNDLHQAVVTLPYERELRLDHRQQQQPVPSNDAMPLPTTPVQPYRSMALPRYSITMPTIGAI